MKWESKGRTYDLITIGEALHWFPIKDAFIKINGLLNERGIFGVYGYMIKDIREISGQKNEKFSRIYKNFEQNTLRKYAEVDVDELFNHYSDEVKYPF